MGLAYRLMMFMLLASLAFQVAVMRVAVDDVSEMAKSTRMTVGLMYDSPPERPQKAAIKRFEPLPTVACPWILKEPVPVNPPTPDTI